MKSLIKFISEQSAKKGRKVTTSEIRRTVDTQIEMYKRAIEELEDLRKKTFQYDEMEHTLITMKQENTVLTE
jgi:chaperonin cofactor prefoldin